MKNSFSENLKKIRKENNLSQEDLAEQLGVSRQSISKWESSQAYPEMDKIITICNKFNVNIDDLLYKDIKEVKDEKKAKSNINKYIDDFLSFITDSINMFISMNLSSKIKCIIEQGLIIFILLIISLIIGSIGSSILSNLLNFLPLNIYNFITNIISAIYKVFIFIALITIVVHIFKIRYLNYYHQVKDNKEDNNKIKIKEDKIIIRDPKNTDYKFINGLFKFIIIIFKLFLLWGTLFLCIGLIMLFTGFITSFLISKSGLFFIGIIGILLSLSIIDIIFIIAILNFVFNRLSNKKILIHSFIISLVLLGISGGLTFVGSLDFKLVKDNSLETKTIEYDINDNTFINNNDITYKEDNRNNIKVEYKINKYCEIKNDNNNANGIVFWSECDDPFRITKEFIKNLNNKKITAIDSNIHDIVIYTNKNNIEKLKNNKLEYEKREINYQDTINYYEKRIYDLERELESLK